MKIKELFIKKKKVEPLKSNDLQNNKNVNNNNNNNNEINSKQTNRDQEKEIKKIKPYTHKKKKLTPKEILQQRNSRLEKAGFSIEARHLDRILLKIGIGVMISIIIILLFLIIRSDLSSGSTALYSILSLIISPFLSYFIVKGATYVIVDYKKFLRAKGVEKNLPDYLQLCALNIKAGMPIDRALWFSVRPKFGVLAKEMEIVAKRTLTGVDLTKGLVDLTKKFDSAVLNRAISLLIAGIDAGGELGDLLNKISTDIQETEILKKEMSASVTTYVIFIGFATIGAAPLLMGLSFHLLSVVQGLALKIGSGGSPAGGMSFFSISPNTIDLNDYKNFAVISLSVTSLFSGMIISIIKKGNIQESFRVIPFYILISISLFYAAKWALSSMFGNII